jgi:hypothetical protein
MGSEVAKNPKMEPGDTVTYDRNGNEIERVIVSDFGESMGKETNKYDSAGQLQETSFTAPDGKVVETLKYTYEAGKFFQSITSDGSGVLLAKTTRKFGPRGELTEETYFDPNTARAKTVFESDGGGKPVKLSFFMINGEKAIAPVGPCLGGHQVLYTYDADGRTASKSVLDTNGRVKKSWTYSYDGRGNQVRGSLKSGSSTTNYEYKYEFDAAGNWIKSTLVSESDDGMLDLILKVTGNSATPEQKKSMHDAAKITQVYIREITYY